MPHLSFRFERFARVLNQAMWLLLAVGLVGAAIAAIRGIVAHGDAMYTDVVPLHFALRVRDGLPMYGDFSEPPFLFLMYWPLYPLISGLIARVAQLDVIGTLYLMRSLSVLATVLTAASVAGLASLCGADRRGSLVAAALFLTAYVVHPWAYSARADLSAIGLVFGGMYVLHRWPSKRAAVLAGLHMGAAFACKQSFVVGVSVAVLALLWRREWTRGALVIVAWWTVVGSTALVMNSLTDGRFLVQTVGGNVLPFRAQTAVNHVTTYLPMAISLLVLAALGWFAPARPDSPLGAMRLYVLVAGMVGVVSIARVGSYYNYFIEVTAALAVIAGLGLTQCHRLIARSAHPDEGARHVMHTRLASIVALSLVVSGLGLPTLAVGFHAAYPPDKPQLIQALRDVDGPVLTQKDGLAVLLAGKSPIAGDPIGVGLLAADGRWSAEPLNDLVRARAFGLIALNGPVERTTTYDEFRWWPPATQELIADHYVLQRRLGSYYLYVPKTEAAEGGRP